MAEPRSVVIPFQEPGDAGVASLGEIRTIQRIIAGAGLTASYNGRTVTLALATDSLTFEMSPEIAAELALINATLATKAPLASPVFTGNPQTPTATFGDSDTTVASTAFVQAAIVAKADLISPVFTGNPQAPNPPVGDNDGTIATTAFVQGALRAAKFISTGIIANGAPTADIPLTGASLYKRMRLIYWGVQPVTTDSILSLRVSLDGGATYKAAATDYRYSAQGLNHTGGAVTINGGAGAALVVISSNIATGSLDSWGEVEVIDPGAGSQFHHGRSRFVGQSSTVNYFLDGFWRFNGISGAITNLRLLFSAGNFAGGNWALIGEPLQ